MPKQSKKGVRKVVKGYALVLGRVGDDLDGMIEYAENSHSLEIYEEEKYAEKAKEKYKNRYGITSYEIVPVVITYSLK